MNGIDYTDYTGPFDLSKGGKVEAYATSPGLVQSIVSDAEISMYIDKSIWRVYSVDSNQGGGEDVKNAIDNNPSTIWHTSYNADQTNCPHEIIIDMANTYKVTAVVYQARQDMSNGRIKEYEIYLSNDPEIWGQPIATGKFKDVASEQIVELAQPLAARYLRLVARSEVNGNAWTSAAEIGIQATEMTDSQPVEGWMPENRSIYYLKDTVSGLFLHSDPEGTDSKLRLGSLDITDTSYQFITSKVSNFSSYYRLKTSGEYLTKGDTNWAIGLATDPTTTNGWLQVEATGDGHYLRGMWKSSTEYFGVDSHETGSYIYSDKSQPMLIEILTEEEAALPAITIDKALIVSENKCISITLPEKSLITVTNIDGIVIASTEAAKTSIKVPTQGIYTVKIQNKETNAAKKILVL